MQLIHGDCLEKMKDIPDKSIDMILCDLPYGTTSCKWDSVIPFEPLWEQYKRVIKDRGAIVLFGSEPFSSLLIASNLPMFKYCWYWRKNRCGNFMTAKYKPLKFIENILVFGFGAVNTKGGKGGGKTNRPFLSYYPQGLQQNVKIVERTKNLPTDGVNRYNKLSNKSFLSNGSSYPKDLLEFDSESQRLHPTQKPTKLLEYLIKTYTLEGEIILDNCMGSGSTGIACLNTNRNFIGIEKDDKYFEIAKNRINNHITSVEGDNKVAP